LRLLLDTHALLWLLSRDQRMSARAREMIRRPDARTLVSAVTVWEIAIKRVLGKLEAPANLLELIHEADRELLSITPEHADATARLPMHHRDPFDRLLIAQAQIEGCALVTRDAAFAAYGVPVVW
jgi:PIN domain nuclease of toxin-antitoxin system